MRIADKAWPLVLEDLNWFIEHGNGKKMYFDEVRRVCALQEFHRPLTVSLITERLALYNLVRCRTQQP